jgi:hypothetical protein
MGYRATDDDDDDDNNNNNNNNNSIRIYLRANLTAQRPITKLTRVRKKKQQQNTASKIKTREFIQ